jgi:hypothetical protein
VPALQGASGAVMVLQQEDEPAPVRAPVVDNGF